jgi:hypothetical protein
VRTRRGGAADGAGGASGDGLLPDSDPAAAAAAAAPAAAAAQRRRAQSLFAGRDADGTVCPAESGAPLSTRLRVTVILDLPPLVGAVFGIGTPDELAALLLAPLLGRTGRAGDTAFLDAFAADWNACVGAPPTLPLALLRFSAGLPTPEEEAVLSGTASAAAAPACATLGSLGCISSAPALAAILGPAVLLLAACFLCLAFLLAARRRRQRRDPRRPLSLALAKPRGAAGAAGAEEDPSALTFA